MKELLKKEEATIQDADNQLALISAWSIGEVAYQSNGIKEVLGLTDNICQKVQS